MSLDEVEQIIRNAGVDLEACGLEGLLGCPSDDEAKIVLIADACEDLIDEFEFETARTMLKSLKPKGTMLRHRVNYLLLWC